MLVTNNLSNKDLAKFGFDSFLNHNTKHMFILKVSSLYSKAYLLTYLSSGVNILSFEYSNIKVFLSDNLMAIFGIIS